MPSPPSITRFYILFEQSINIIESFAFARLNLYIIFNVLYLSWPISAIDCGFTFEANGDPQFVLFDLLFLLLLVCWSLYLHKIVVLLIRNILASFVSSFPNTSNCQSESHVCRRRHSVGSLMIENAGNWTERKETTFLKLHNGLLPLNKFRKFRLEFEWNKNFRGRGNIRKSQWVLFVQSHFWYQFQAFAAVFR